MGQIHLMAYFCTVCENGFKIFYIFKVLLKKGICNRDHMWSTKSKIFTVLLFIEKVSQSLF